MDVGFELVEHTADIGLRAWGRTRAEVFQEAARGMLSLVCDPKEIQGQRTVEVEVESTAPDLLLAAWLNEVLFQFEARSLLFSEIEVLELGDTHLRAQLRGEELDPERHFVCGGVKAATLHDLSLQPRDDGWEGFVILDV